MPRCVMGDAELAEVLRDQGFCVSFAVLVPFVDQGLDGSEGLELPDDFSCPRGIVCGCAG